ncbi:MAG: hypothetical protein HYZ42_06075, partial [Bacteroidetes bacterium]|nr:hypothetical protein [Bacteroidota bacterium]
MNNARLSALSEQLKKPSVILLMFYFCFGFWFNDLLKPYNSYKNETNFVWDAAGYYSYLPATFYYHGTFEFNNGYESFLPVNAEGKRYPKYTYGVALIEAPFYGVAYVIASLKGQPVNGFSAPFADTVRWGAMLFVFLGLLYLRKFLLIFYNEIVTSITLFCCIFASMLYMYTFIQGEISHGYLFTLFTMFIYYTHKWHLQQKHIYSIYLASILGLISVVRFTEVYFVFVFIFWNVTKFSDLKTKFFFFLKHFEHLLWFPLIGFIFWIPQLLFWKHISGMYLYDPYVGEHFFWKDPQVLNVLFSYRKGWITYTPIALLGFIGVFFIKRD